MLDNTASVLEIPVTFTPRPVTLLRIPPFDLEEAFRQKPVRLAGRRHGWLVSVGPGGRVSVSVTPTARRETLAKAVAQSKQTTQPSKARADATET